ncbi:MAG: LysM peptidoglycan-binding domain-containing protein [Methylophilaceae bacterium]|nr:LysM peptidoglycan-binding domain-containing protein [Methylophilaceae bacterium]
MYARIITWLLLFLSFTSVASARDLRLKEGHPERHIVVKGDTLWGISSKFLNDPWRWPEIWKMNREQIKNPHRIYPGDVILLSLDHGRPELRLLRETVTLEPGAIIEPLEKAPIPTIAPAVIAPFLSQPLVVENKQLEEAPEIIGTPDDRLLLGSGHRAYVSAIPEDAGLQWQLFRPGKPLVDPDTQETLGYEAIYLGDAKVVRYGEPATINITRSKQEISLNDKLVVAPEKLMGNFVPRAPELEIQGRIMTSYENTTEIGRNAIVTINRGMADGLESGHVLAVYSAGRELPKKKAAVDPRDHKPELNIETTRDAEGKLIVNLKKDDEAAKTIKLPDERIGLVMIFRTFERVSYALVMQSERPIHINDVVKNP